jgi:hypothetical protein
MVNSSKNRRQEVVGGVAIRGGADEEWLRWENRTRDSSF